MAAIIIDGSYVTRKQEPEDIDLIVALKPGFDPLSELRPFEYNVQSRRMVKQFYKFDAKRSVRIQQKVDVLNILQHEISTFLVLLSRQSVSAEMSVGIPHMFQIVNALKNQGDQCNEILELLRRKKENKISFSTAAMSELKALASKVEALVHLSAEVMGEEKVEDLAQVIAEVFHNVIDRLQPRGRIDLNRKTLQQPAGGQLP